MPDVAIYHPPWLSYRSPGSEIFKPHPNERLVARGRQREDLKGSSRLIAKRGTEIFVAVGKELRWANLTTLQHDHELHRSNTGERSNCGDETGVSYRMLRISLPADIKQLIISPNGDFIAVLTLHTAHLALIPDLIHLSSATSPIRLKAWQVGPTEHVVERSAIASALWHPLGSGNGCFVTITQDAVIRLWELDRHNKWSFDTPSTAIDMRKLANGLSAEEDFTPSKYGANKSFSPDSVEMEVASAMFGGSGEFDNVWIPLTLWVVMTEGDVYALCPLLPKNWETSLDYFHKLEETITVEVGALSGETFEPMKTRRLQRRMQWFRSLSIHKDKLADRFSVVCEGSTNSVGVPMLQGPLRVFPDLDQVSDITDIAVMSTTTSTKDARSELDRTAQVTGLHSKLNNGILICLLTHTGIIHICTVVPEIEGHWLPQGSASLSRVVEGSYERSELLVLESLRLSEDEAEGWPVFTKDAMSLDTCFITASSGVYGLSLNQWIKSLDSELPASNSNLERGGFRANVIIDNAKSSLERFIDLSHASTQGVENSAELMVAVAVSLVADSLGHVLLTCCNGHPYAVVLSDIDHQQASLDTEDNFEYGEDEMALKPVLRVPYVPHDLLWRETTLPTFVANNVHKRSQRSMSSEIRVNSSNMELMMEAHRVLASETQQLNIAVAELFRRCRRLQEEFQQQVQRVSEVFNRIDEITDHNRNGDDAAPRVDEGSAEFQVAQRFKVVGAKCNQLTIRYGDLRRKLASLSGRPLSEKELVWMREIDGMDKSACSPEDPGSSVRDARAIHIGRTQHWQRLGRAKRLEEQLMEEVKDFEKINNDERTSWELGAGQDDVPWVMQRKDKEKRKQNREIERLLEREGSLLEAMANKLDRLRGLAN